MTNGQLETLSALRVLLADSESVPTLAQIERVAITTAIDRFGVMEAGHMLDIGKTTVYRKMLEYRMPSPRSRRHAPSPALVILESRTVLESARRAADYLLRCVGAAKAIGAELDRKIRPYEPAPAKTVAMGAAINDASQNGDGVAPGKRPENDSSERRGES